MQLWKNHDKQTGVSQTEPARIYWNLWVPLSSSPLAGTTKSALLWNAGHFPWQHSQCPAGRVSVFGL